MIWSWRPTTAVLPMRRAFPPLPAFVDETALRELSEQVIEKLKLLTDAEFGELEFSPD